MTSLPQGISIIQHFETLEDPRMLRTQRHSLISIIVLAVAGVICHCDSWVEIEEFAKTKEAFFKTFLSLPNGIPSHDTFGRVFSVIDARAFQDCFVSWVKELVQHVHGNVVSIDGKTLRRSTSQSKGKSALHMVSAWTQEYGLVLGAIATHAKSNEITAIPELLRLLFIEGCMVTTDAMGCQKKIIHDIVERKADYCIAVKENQKQLYEAVKDSFIDITQTNEKETFETVEKGHGRIEKRVYTIITDQRYVEYINPTGAWEHLKGVGQVEATRTINGISSQEKRYYILSSTDVKQFAHAVRNHWGIENSLHWVLDVDFNEDQCRIRSGYADQNMAVLRHIAINLIKKNTTKGSIKTKRLKSGWDETFLLQVLTPSLI